MLTGTVNIAYIGSSSQAATLFISGDNAANAIAIRQVPSSGGVPRIEIQGINTKLVATTSGAATPSQTGTSFTFAASDILVAMGGGNDSLAITNLKLPGTLTIDMGAGNDRLTMTSVQFQAPSLVFTNALPTGITIGPQELFQINRISLGSGNDVAILNNVTSTDNIVINAGDGNDAVALNRVAAADPDFSRALTVEMGGGAFDILSVSNSSADIAAFNDTGGAHGLLARFKNHFGTETHAGFQIVI
jgi:hypothetical protein